MSFPSSKYRSPKEDPVLSCRVLADWIIDSNRPNQDDGKKAKLLRKKFYLHDFAAKAKNPLLRNIDLSRIVNKILINEAPKYIQDILGEIVAEMNEKKIEKTEIDVAFFTILPNELLSAKVALGINRYSKADNNISGLRVWHTDVFCENRDQPLKCILTMVGEARNVFCVNACRTIFGHYNVRNAVLIGIAAGNPEKLKLGDVVSPKFTWDVEGGRLEPDGFKLRSEISVLRIIDRRDLSYFDPKALNWHELLHSKLKELKEFPEANLPEELGKDWQPSFKGLKVQLAGEKLAADGETLPQLRNITHEEAISYDMESYGFPLACEECGVGWLIFRGISDFGDPKTKNGEIPVDPQKDKWQQPAALAAATAAVLFLQKISRIKDIEF